ncbi:MAG: helix-turn-helix domain-containing protein [Oscillospiraceae bacterium]|nr:helix-turn-helix domain-containing protein [Oscillospiraceae bacterium]
MSSEMPKVYKISDVAEMLQVTRRTIYNYLKDGRIEAVKIGRNWYVTEEHLNNLLSGKLEKSKTNLAMQQEHERNL